MSGFGAREVDRAPRRQLSEHVAGAADGCSLRAVQTSSASTCCDDDGIDRHGSCLKRVEIEQIQGCLHTSSCMYVHDEGFCSDFDSRLPPRSKMLAEAIVVRGQIAYAPQLRAIPSNG